MEVHQSDVQTMAECPIKLRHRQEAREAGLRRRAKITASMGTSYHAGMEQHYKSRMNGEKWTLDDSLGRAEAALDDDLANQDVNEDTFVFKAETKRSEAERVYVGAAKDMVGGRLKEYFEQGRSYVDADGWNVVLVESEWTLPNPYNEAHKLAGRWDLVLSRDGNTIVVDWKTARDYRANVADRWQHRKTVQPALYSWAAKGTGVSDPTAGLPVWVADVAFWNPAGPRQEQPGQAFERYTVTVTATDVQLALRRAAVAGELMERPELLMANPSSTFCSPQWCEWWTVCDWGGVEAEESF